jgi:ABC-type branched-subunit amino acid transport system substrate-binding protein
MRHVWLLFFLMLVVAPAGCTVQAQPLLSGSAAPSGADNYIFHVARRGQTKEEILQQYGITMEVLYQHNPELRLNQLRRGQVVKVPVSSRSAQTDNRVGPTEASAAPAIMQQEPPVAPPVMYFGKNRVFRVAVLLPLYLPFNRFDAAMAADTSLTVDFISGGLRNRQGDYWIYQPSQNFLNFYEGILLALDALKRQGVEIRLQVYDTGRDVAGLRRVLDNPALREADLMIGPFYTEQIEQVMSFAQANRIYCVSPLTSREPLLVGNRYLFQVTTSSSVLNDSLAAYVSRQKDALVTVLVNVAEPASRSARWLAQIRAALPQGRFREIRVSSSGLSADFLRDNERNVVVSFSEDEIFVGRMLAILNLAARTQNKEVELCGLSSWTSFSNLNSIVNLEYLHNLSFVCAAPFFVDYSHPDMTPFLEKHRKYFGTEPSEFYASGYNYTFLGYDIMWFFGSALDALGKDMGDRIADFSRSALLTDFDFRRPGASDGYANQGVRLFRYTRSFELQHVR